MVPFISPPPDLFLNIAEVSEEELAMNSSLSQDGNIKSVRAGWDDNLFLQVDLDSGVIILPSLY